jgi:NADH-quinone oxidoreductase subunit J
MVDAVFIALSIITIGSAILTLESREILYGGIALAISMLGIAGYFIILDAPFVAMFQIAVYVGAVAVLIIFTVMLVRSPNTVTKRETKKKKILGMLIGLALIALVIPLISNSVNKQLSFTNTISIDIKEIGTIINLLLSGIDSLGFSIGRIYYRCLSTCKKGGYRRKK